MINDGEAALTNNPTGRIRRRKKMLQQIRQNDQQEEEFHTAMKNHEKRLFDDAFRRAVSGLVVLFFVGVIGIVYTRPKFLFPNTQRLPSRTITTVYPRHLKISEALPPVVLGYAIASNRNERERAAVRHVGIQRQLVTYAHSGTRQVIRYHPMEHDEFVRKLITSQPGALDFFCGSGYQHMYQQRAQSLHPEDEDAALDDMLLACLIQSGTADGYVKHSVHLHSSLSRRTQGVAVQYRNERRIHSDLMFMPILEQVGKQNKKSKPTPATMLPLEMTKFLLATVEPGMSEWIYRQEWEEFLYKVIVDTETSKWTLFTAVCTEEERTELSAIARSIATSCRGSNECCWIFDQSLEPR